MADDPCQALLEAVNQLAKQFNDVDANFLACQADLNAAQSEEANIQTQMDQARQLLGDKQGRENAINIQISDLQQQATAIDKEVRLFNTELELVRAELDKPHGTAHPIRDETLLDRYIAIKQVLAQDQARADGIYQQLQQLSDELNRLWSDQQFLQTGINNFQLQLQNAQQREATASNCTNSHSQQQNDLSQKLQGAWQQYADCSSKQPPELKDDPGEEGDDNGSENQGSTGSDGNGGSDGDGGEGDGGGDGGGGGGEGEGHGPPEVLDPEGDDAIRLAGPLGPALFEGRRVHGQLQRAVTIKRRFIRKLRNIESKEEPIRQNIRKLEAVLRFKSKSAAIRQAEAKRQKAVRIALISKLKASLNSGDGARKRIQNQIRSRAAESVRLRKLLYVHLSGIVKLAHAVVEARRPPKKRRQS
jgi:uncharacterized membrane protein YgcG